jgi:hypothetical protein
MTECPPTAQKTFSIDDAVKRQPETGRRAGDRPAYLSARTRIAERAGNVAIGRDHAAWDLLDDCEDVSREGRSIVASFVIVTCEIFHSLVPVGLKPIDRVATLYSAG